ncbi:MAG TPA: MerR family transcriptional regulator [Gemmatimonadales bacterium]|nr:MerR family transcriptional regulator [Gemmatimonadales bacterium]
MFAMWMSELSQRSGLPVATIKYYLREGLLPPGEATGATRSRYDDGHVRRLRLIRALVEVAGMRLDEVRDILAAVDDPSVSLHEALGSAHTRLSASASGTSARAPSAASSRRVAALLRRAGWKVSTDSAHRAALARALDALASVDHDVSDALLDAYVAAMASVAEREVAGAVSDGERETATERAVVGTLLLEPVLLTIRRMAQENASARSLGRKRRS